jgi:transposase
MSDKPSPDKPIDLSIPDTEVTAETTPFKKRKNLTVAYKLRILAQVEKLKGSPGEVGALLRKEGLYSSHLSNWKRDRAEGKFDSTSSAKRGAKSKLNEYERENAKLRAELAEARLENEQSQKLIEAQKKIAEFLEIANRRASLGKKPSSKP